MTAWYEGIPSALIAVLRLLPIDICSQIVFQHGLSMPNTTGRPPACFFTVISDAKLSVTCKLLKKEGTHTNWRFP
jgi:hypothetical protein